MRAWMIALLAVSLCGNLSCSVNILETFANKRTSEALYQEAIVLMNKEDFVGAVEKLNAIEGDFAVDRKVLKLKGEAYAGICGLRFIPFVLALKDLGTARIFPFLTDHFRNGTTTKIDACVAAEDLVESIGAIGSRTVDENFLLALISFAKMGAILNFYVDDDENGVVDGGYDPCVTNNTTRVEGPLYDDDVNQMVVSLALTINNLTAVGSSVDLGSGTIAALQGVCTTLEGIDPSFNFCTVTDPTTVTAAHRQGIRSLLNEDTVAGLGTCTGDITTCMCP